MTKPMSDKTIQIYIKYENKWVALDEKRELVLASGSSIKELEEKLIKKKVSPYEIKYILPLNKSFAPLCL